MRERRRDYELLFIVSPLRSSEDEIANAINRVRQSIAGAGGEMTDVDQSPPWGRRKFAYPIREYAEGEASRRPFNEGIYVLCHFNLASTRIPEIERALKLNDSVLRYLLTLVDPRTLGKGRPVAAGADADTASSFGGADADDIDDDAEDDEEQAGLLDRTSADHRWFGGAREQRRKVTKMAKDLNKVLIIGRLGKDPEMRYTTGGSPVTTFSVAAGRQWKDGNGDAREETEWFNVVTWNKLAEICNEHLRKASRVYIEGRLQTHQWQDAEGRTRYRTEVIASDMIMLDGRGPRDGTPDEEYEQRPSTRNSVNRSSADIGDEDIPF